MKKDWVVPVIGLTGLVASGWASAGVQTIFPSQSSFEVSPGDTVEFIVKYSADSPDDATGLGLKLFFDSTKLSFVETTEVFQTGKLTDSTTADTSNLDADPNTDQFYNIAWTGFGLPNAWPATGAVDTSLYRIKFIATQAFSSDTVLNFTGDSTANDTLAFTPVTVAYKDTIAPEITAPSNVTVEATGSTTVVASSVLGNPTVTDNNDPSPSVSYDPQGPYTVGAHTITWLAEDASGNSASASQTLTVEDSTAPQITAPSDISTVATGSTTEVSLGTPVITEAVDPNPSVTPDKTGPFTFGSHTITWTAEDASGNKNTATQIVTITEPGAPTLTAPADITAEATGQTTPVTLGTVTGVDVIQGDISAAADKSGPFEVGAHTITWTVSNDRGGETTATQKVTIEDTTGPVITAPPAKTVQATGQATVVDLGAAQATDLVDGTVSVTSNAPANFGVGAHTVTWTATDNAGNTTTATQKITVSDSDGPTITAPSDITAEATGATTAITLGTATASDAVDGELTATPDKTGPFAVGEHAIIWTVSDSSGNTATATQTVTVTDKTAPILNAPGDISMSATGAQTIVDLGSATATDIVDGALTPTPDKSGPFEVGAHTITWTVADNEGNSSTATQTVTITDTDGPTIVAPADKTVEATAQMTPVQLGTATATDNVDGALTPTADNTGPFAIGTHTITWSVKDGAGNPATAKQTIIVQDKTGPAITPPPNAVVAATGVSTAYDVGTATALDLVDGTVSVTSDAPSSFNVGEHTVTWTATDQAGNTSTATQTITVSDSDGPAITAPANISVEATAVLTPVKLGAATATDVVDGELSATADKTGPFAVGEHTITWTATDSADNTATATQTVKVEDTTAPTMTAPADQTVAATGQQTAVELGAPTVTDVADASPTVIADVTGPFGVGTHTITWTATDASGNSATATQSITVSDSGVPTVTAPANITVEATGAETLVDLGAVTATDAIDGALTATADKTGPFGVGVHTITWSVTDSAGNNATAVQTVTVTDTKAPSLQIPADQTVSATGETTEVNIGVASATDLVDGSVTATPDNTGPFTVGTHTITWTVSDTAGNNTTATQTITVTDGDGPVVNAPADITVEATGETTEVDFGTATATDSVDGELTATPDKQGPFVIGTHTITWTATDSVGNEATAIQTITVEDTSEPVISIEASTLQLTATGVLTAIEDFGISTTDAVDGSVATVGKVLVPGNGNPQPLPEGGFTSGTHELVWTATDNAGNTATANQTIEITPLANFVATQSASAGDAVTVTAELSGEAVAYPVTIPYSIDTQASTVVNDGSDHDAANGVITIESATTGNFSFNVAANPALSGTGQGDLVFTMAAPTNAATGSASTHTVVISADNIAPVVQVAMTQADTPVTKVTKDAGSVIITAQATDSAAQTLSYDWSQSDSALADQAADSDDATFELDPSALEEGTYNIVVAVRDNGSPLKETIISKAFKVVAGETVVADTDGDGIEDSKDNVAETNRLPAQEGASDAYVLESEPGTTLTLGAVALDQEQADAGIDTSGLPTIPEEYEDSALEIYDFEISGIVQGGNTYIVIPQQNPLPAGATYLKYDGTSWKTFAQDANNIVYSAAGTGNGVCPPTRDSSYAEGLAEGHYCVQLKIEDGGANDTDGMVNGNVADPGVIVGPANTGSITMTSTGGGGGSMPWYLLPFFLLLGLIRRGLFRK